MVLSRSQAIQELKVPASYAITNYTCEFHRANLRDSFKTK